MTTAEMLAWVDAYMSGLPKISPATMRNFFLMLAENFAHVDAPLDIYSDQIANTDLDGNLQVTITHSLATTVPEVVMFDETGSRIYDEYFECQVVDQDNILLTFNDTIPVSGTGYYTIIVYFLISSVPSRYDAVFTSALDSWTGDVPDDFTVDTPTLGSPTLENDTNRAKLTADGVFRIALIPDVVLEENRNYRYTVKLDQGDMVIASGLKKHTLTTTGTFIFVLMAGATTVSFKQKNSEIAIIDSILIEEEI